MATRNACIASATRQRERRPARELPAHVHGIDSTTGRESASADPGAGESPARPLTGPAHSWSSPIRIPETMPQPRSQPRHVRCIETGRHGIGVRVGARATSARWREKEATMGKHRPVNEDAITWRVPLESQEQIVEGVYEGNGEGDLWDRTSDGHAHVDDPGRLSYHGTGVTEIEGDCEPRNELPDDSSVER
jgi:hypothetical protein